MDAVRERQRGFSPEPGLTSGYSRAAAAYHGYHAPVPPQPDKSLLPPSLSGPHAGAELHSTAQKFDFYRAAVAGGEAELGRGGGQIC